jgi:hypothetical protein
MNGKRKQQPTLENIQRAVSSIIENYLPIFMPVTKLHQNKVYKIFRENNNVLKLKTHFGTLEIRNRILTQQHKDILEHLLSENKMFLKEDQSMYVDIDSRYKFLKSMGQSPTKYVWLEENIKQIKDMSLIVEFDNNEKTERYSFDIIDSYKFRLDKKTGKEKLSIKFSQEFTAFYLDNNLLDYKKHIGEIANLKTPFLKSLVRYMLIHKQHQINVNTFIENMGYHTIVSQREIYNFKKQLKDHAEELEKFDIYTTETKNGHTVKINCKSKLLEQNKKNYPIKQETLFDF